MAVQVLPDSPSAGMSPRISFSHDLPQNDIVPIEHYVRSSTSSSIDFDFCVFRDSLDQESSSADELFFDGKILPIEIQKRLAAPLRSSAAAPPPLPPSLPPPPRATQKTNIEEKQSQKTSSFWRFKRSASLNCGNGYATSLCPLPLLSRSNSTGSTASVKRSSSSNNQKQSFQKYALSNAPLKQSWSTNYQKPPLKKSGYCYNGGPRINPVLNVPSANLFGLASLFSGAKDKAKKK